jgi:hypothetical protein
MAAGTFAFLEKKFSGAKVFAQVMALSRRPVVHVQLSKTVRRVRAAARVVEEGVAG